MRRAALALVLCLAGCSSADKDAALALEQDLELFTTISRVDPAYGITTEQHAELGRSLLRTAKALRESTGAEQGRGEAR